MTMIGIRFDLRVPPFAEVTHAEQYAACLDMCAWADELGFDIVVLSEHHGVDDGYMSSPVTLAAAILGRTKRVAVNIAAALIPLHDPVRLAEQLATVSLASGGRLSLVAGLGYRQEEFDMAGVERRRRGRLLEEYVGVMQKAWSGEVFAWNGRNIRVTPKPAVPPTILVGGSTEKAARRAARLRAGFFPAVGDPELAKQYEDACAEVGFDGGFVMLPGGPGYIHVSDDPDRDWQRVGPHALWDAQTYDSWQTSDQGGSEVHVAAKTVADVRASGVYSVVTPDGCVELAQRHGRLIFHPLMGGLPVEFGWEGLRRFEREVLPRLRS